MAFVLLIHSETLGVKVNNPTCFLKCSDWDTLNCYILYINYPILAGYSKQSRPHPIKSFGNFSDPCKAFAPRRR